MDRKTRILIVEDDSEIVELLTLHLRDLGYEVEHAQSGSEGLRKAEHGKHALIILDIMLPEMDGIEVCKRLRQQNRYTPILMLTAKSDEVDRVVGLEVGADDYVSKPFSIREVIARVRALLRRVEQLESASDQGRGSETIEFGYLRVELGTRRALIRESAVNLTTKEFDLLVALCRNPGQAFNREQLLELVWGYQYEGYNHTVNSHINRLRAKIEDDPSNPDLIQTVWGYGYRFVPPGNEP